ncbi:MAG: carbohydrate ABC transporter permease [Candidatus Acetothermia bacterium]
MKSRTGKWFRYLFLTIASLAVLFPFYLMTIMAFKASDEILAGNYLLPTLQPSFNNFMRVFAAADFFTYLINTVLVVTGILALQLLLIIPAAYVFARIDFPGSGFVFILYVIQIMLPLQALIVPNYRIMNTFGLVDTRLALILPFVGSGYCAFLLRQSFKQVPQSLIDSAIIDGCGHFNLIRKVFLPLSKPTIAVFSLISIATHWNDYLWPLIITDSSKVRTLTIGLGMFVQHESGADWGMLMAATLFITLPLIIFFLVIQRSFIENFMTSGLKG